MLTARGWWFLIVVLFALVLGAFLLPYYTVTPVLLAFTLLTWFTIEWVYFHLRLNAAAAKLRCRRRVVQGGRDVPMVWAGLPFEVHVQVGHDGSARLPFAVCEDRLPAIADLLEGDNEFAGELLPGQPAEVTYTLRCPSPGVLRFEGVKVRVADLHGFFYKRLFLREPVEYYVLPPLSDDEGKQRADKRFNTLPPPGVHRFRRPGSGSELLDLRDYRPGDPPKMIAWKASARRDRLITKEYESDVPVRSVLFVDTSEAVRLGPPGFTPVARLAGVASSVAQAATANRDIVGLTTFDEQEAKTTQPARTKLHMINVMRRLAEAAALQPGTKGVAAAALTARAYPLANELYPDLMAKKTNTMPLGRLWLPLLDSRWGWFALFLIFVATPFLVTYKGWLALTISAAVKVGSPSWFWMLRLLVWFFVALFLIFLPVTIALVFWFFFGVRGFFGRRKRELSERKRLSAVLALQDGTGPGGIERLIHDDELYAERVGAFLQHHQYRCPVPLYDDDGRYRFRCAGKAQVLAEAIVRAVSRARDNELYVVLADLAELGDDLAPVVRAARLARARKHHVMILLPWPADVPSPDEAPEPEPIVGEPVDSDGRPWGPPKKAKPRKSRPAAAATRAARLVPLVTAGLTRQYHEAFRRARRELSGVGATVLRVNEGDPVQLVLDRLDRLRGMRTRR